MTRPEVSGPLPAAGDRPETRAVASGPPGEEEVDGNKSPLCPLSGGNLRGPRHGRPRPPLLRILRQLPHNPHLPAVDVLHFLCQVRAGAPYASGTLGRQREGTWGRAEAHRSPLFAVS